jgi:hypothetical protein
VIRDLHAMTPETAATALSRSGDGPSFSDWKRVQTFFDSGAVDIDSLEPSHLDYREAQRGAYEETLQSEKDSLKQTDEGRRRDLHDDSRPGLQEGIQATLLSAAVEGGTALVLAVVKKRRDGKKLRAFTADDWVDIAGVSGVGAAKGSVRGLTIYSLTNFTATSSAVASSIVTSAFGIAELANELRRGEIDERQFIENSELVCLDTAVSALSSLIGQTLIPVPVLGAVIGNTIGTVMYQAARSSLSEREMALIAGYARAQRELDEALSADYAQLIAELTVSLADYFDVLERAFSPDVLIAVQGSIELASTVGVKPEDLLDGPAKARRFFLD